MHDDANYSHEYTASVTSNTDDHNKSNATHSCSRDKARASFSPLPVGMPYFRLEGLSRLAEARFYLNDNSGRRRSRRRKWRHTTAGARPYYHYRHQAHTTNTKARSKPTSSPTHPYPTKPFPPNNVRTAPPNTFPRRRVVWRPHTITLSAAAYAASAVIAAAGAACAANSNSRAWTWVRQVRLRAC